MKKDISLITLGVWIVVVPFLGFPGTWKTIIFVISGLAVVLLTVLWRHELLRSGFPQKKGNHDVFVENGNVPQRVERHRLRVVSDETSEHGEAQANS